VDYARVVAAIGNEEDITNVDLDGVLPSATIMVVSVTASTTAGQPLPDAEIEQVLEGCKMALALDEDRADILRLVQTKMGRIAPNLSAVVGTAIAAQLMGVAGGLSSLSQMPACNIQVLGAKRKSLAGFSTAAAQPHHGFISNCDLVQGVPPALRSQAARIIGGKTALLARIDAANGDPTGQKGQEFRDAIAAKLEKLHEPPPAKQATVLPKPDMEGKKRRGGKRFRKMKERYGLTDTRKAANRVNFNQAEEEFLDGDEMVGLGTLSKNAAGGRLRIAVRAQKQKLSAKTQKRAKQYAAHGAGGAGTVSGLSSSLAFTPVQGIELHNPNAAAADADMKSGTESYFSEYSGFRSLAGSGSVTLPRKS
jgi:U4/U6 small nuclear ribonucleoprotein PRP31